VKVRGSPLMSFESTSKTLCIACRPSFCLVLACRACSTDPHLPGVRTSSLGVLKDSPSIDIHTLDAPLRFFRLDDIIGTSPHDLTMRARFPRRFTAPGQVSTPRPRRVLRPEQATAPTCSVLAVPPDFDGLLHLRAAGLLRPAADLGIHHVSGTSSTTSNPCPPKRTGRSLPMTTVLACS